MSATVAGLFVRRA